MAELALVVAVRVHHPDFFVTGPIRNKVDLSTEQGGAAHLGYDVGGEFVGGFPGSGLIRRAEIALAEDLGLRNRGLSHVEQPAVEHQDVVLHGAISECELVRRNRRRGPVREPGAATVGWWLARARGLGGRLV